jgi:hypothetical protein
MDASGGAVVQHLSTQLLAIADFQSKEHLQAKIRRFSCDWNQRAHPCNWSMKFVAKVMAEGSALAA